MKHMDGKKMDSKERKFILERIYNHWKVNIYVFDENDHLTEVYNRENSAWKEGCAPSGKKDMPADRAVFLEKIRKECSRGNTPRLFPDIESVYDVAFVDEQNNLYAFGPVAVEEISFAQLVAYRRQHGINHPKYKIPVLKLGELINVMSLSYYMITGKCVTEEEIFEANNLSSVQGEDADKDEVMIYEITANTEERRRLAYRDEQKWAAEIENGTRMNTKELFQSENLEKLEMIGTLSSKNAYKQYEYMVITSTCLACRAAIRGGVNVYDAYAQADIFYQKISMCSNIMELLQLYAEVADEFSSQVRKAKEKPYMDVVEQCKDYISRHRMEKFSLSQLAEVLKKNPSYLSRIFSEQTGVTLQGYALTMRLEAGANLLKYSNHSVGEIAEYLHFSTQSYFGEYFKRQYGQTPAEYRRRNKIRDFEE